MPKKINHIDNIKKEIDNLILCYKSAEDKLKSGLGEISNKVDELVLDEKLTKTEIDRAKDLIICIQDKLRSVQFDSISELESEKILTKLKNTFGGSTLRTTWNSTHARQSGSCECLWGMTHDTSDLIATHFDT